MQIPKQFKLFGQTITVEWDKTLVQQNDETGQARYRDNKIVMQPSTGSIPIPHSQLEQTFCHEWVHHILVAMGEKDLAQNEQFVDTFARLLHQSIISMDTNNE